MHVFFCKCVIFLPIAFPTRGVGGKAEKGLIFRLVTHGTPEYVQKCSYIPGSNWNLEMLAFEERGKPENPEKPSRSREENQQETQPTYDAGSRNRTRDTLLVEGERSHHCAIPAPQGAKTIFL